MKEINDILSYTISQYKRILSLPEWSAIESLFKESKSILICTHGGNIAIARHLSSNLSRHLGWQKNIQTPDSDIVAIWHGDYEYDSWLTSWLESKLSCQEDTSKVLVLGLSSSGASPDVDRAVGWAHKRGIPNAYISARPIDPEISAINVVTNMRHYYASEVMFMSLCYRLLNCCGVETQQIKTLTDDVPQKIRENSYSDELDNVGIDFDGVIHRNSKGFYDGTVYDVAIEGSRAALERLSKKYRVVIYSAKARFDRMIVNGKTGVDLIWEWLRENDMSQYVAEVTAEKPRARFYIDDKAIRFTDWDSAFKMIEEVDG